MSRSAARLNTYRRRRQLEKRLNNFANGLACALLALVMIGVPALALVLQAPVFR